MQFSHQWLKTWVESDLSVDELAHLLTMAGLEIESLTPAAPLFSGVVIAEVLTVTAHENADRLRVCQVDVGRGESLQIVCGAANVREGVKVPCAMIGAQLPENFTIKATKMRGVASNGMLCSGQELGIPDGVDGLLILPSDAPVGADIREYLALDDTIFELKITPNRADCLSILGVAREVSALTSVAMSPPEICPVAAQTSQASREVQILAPEACGRYVGRAIYGVNAAAATPLWMTRVLNRAGIRSVSALVDITNYVMLELGQPLHAFDNNKLSGNIEVRWAREGERLTLLNGKDIALDADMLLIADAQGAVALAGVMGGENSEVDTQTTDVFLESAFFAPNAIAGRARRLGFSSDASFRFERGVDFTLQAQAIARATALIVDICGGTPSSEVEALGKLPVRAPVGLRIERLNKILGVQLTLEECAAILQRLSLNVTQTSDNCLSVIAPAARFDIEREEDLIEEIARVYGYDNIPADAVHGRLNLLPLPETAWPRSELRRVMVAREYQEVISYAFVDARWEADFVGQTQPVKLLNPIASQMSVMRTSLIGGLVDILAANLKRKQPRVRIFEIARVFIPDEHAEQGVAQPEKIAGLAFGGRAPEQWGVKSERVDFFDVKADVEALLASRVAEFTPAQHPAFHPGRCAEVWLDRVCVGVLGELHPKWVQAYELTAPAVLFELELSAVLRRESVQVQPVSKLPQVRRDLALLVEETITVGALLDTLKRAASTLVTEIALFDLYQGKGVPEGKKSLAFKVLMQDTARTLTDAEIDDVMAHLLNVVETEHAAQLRM